MPTETTAPASRGSPVSNPTTRRSSPSGTPDRRSWLNGRLRSFSPATTVTARLHPATARLTMITTSASC